MRALMAVMFLLSISVSTSYAAGAYRVGDQGEEIAELQGKLVVLGYDVMADGAFGPAMADAIKEFQKSQGIKADGLIGPATYSALLGKDMPDISRGSNYISNRIRLIDCLSTYCEIKNVAVEKFRGGVSTLDRKFSARNSGNNHVERL